jgi:hypothetical protein
MTDKSYTLEDEEKALAEVEIMRLERIQIIRELDITKFKEGLQSMMPALEFSDYTVTVALHKSRYLCNEIEDKLRLESKDWLAMNNLGSIWGEPLLPKNELP